ncbi:hypothetical protein [Salinicoccus sp. HZC-1]|uniref:hypothetical protein n=1 Tax=Salinicoccus sp. HZC-1 TaxID=3385497 RepID=UPI00398AB296
MEYEKEIARLKKERNKSAEKYKEAEDECYITDSEIWLNDIENLDYQIYIHEQAAKADANEAKAQAFDEIAQIYDENTGLGEQDEDSTNFETLVGEVGSVINSVESGGSE